MEVVRPAVENVRIKQRRAWLLLGWVTAERSCPCKQPACPAVSVGSEVNFKPLVPKLSVREGFLAENSPDVMAPEVPSHPLGTIGVVLPKTKHEERRLRICFPPPPRPVLLLELFCSLNASDVETMQGVRFERLHHRQFRITRDVHGLQIPISDITLSGEWNGAKLNINIRRINVPITAV
ncbi:hypothetical protein J6590_090418 [Homalodisca vitripennis]|nr:hypothetical protein J6590_090418 [Homalodisca vitripennis]